MNKFRAENIRDPELVWVAILQASQEHRDAELAQIAMILYGQLGQARAEVSRLRASLKASLEAISYRGEATAGGPAPRAAAHASGR